MSVSYSYRRLPYTVYSDSLTGRVALTTEHHKIRQFHVQGMICEVEDVRVEEDGQKVEYYKTLPGRYGFYPSYPFRDVSQLKSYLEEYNQYMISIYENEMIDDDKERRERIKNLGGKVIEFLAYKFDNLLFYGKHPSFYGKDYPHFLSHAPAFGLKSSPKTFYYLSYAIHDDYCKEPFRSKENEALERELKLDWESEERAEKRVLDRDGEGEFEKERAKKIKAY